MERYHQLLTEHREAINQLNVYPVKNGDTGTNMNMTVGSVWRHIEDAETLPEIAHDLTHGSLIGARGYSGVILSQILRGLAGCFGASSSVGAVELAAGFRSAAETAYKAVLNPVEGTILTVLRETAEAAPEAVQAAKDDLARFVDAVYQAGHRALLSTPRLLPILKKAGVVDAGGAGFMMLLTALKELTTGVVEPTPDYLAGGAVGIDRVSVGDENLSGLRYEVMFFLASDDEAPIDGFRKRWAELGDSIVMVGGEGLYNCHIHTDHIGPSIEAALMAGRPTDIQVTDLLGQTTEAQSDERFAPSEAALMAPVGVVAVVAGFGLKRIFRDSGVQAIASGGQSMNPSTEQLLEAVERAPAPSIILLPNNKNIVPVAEQVDALTAKMVRVVPTRSIPQGIAAMYAYQTGEPSIDDLVEDMAAAASSIEDAALTRAVKAAEVESGRIEPGDWLGMSDGSLVIIDKDLHTAATGLVALVSPDKPELVTVITGLEAGTADSKAIEAWLSDRFPKATIEMVAGGQPHYPYLFSIE